MKLKIVVPLALFLSSVSAQSTTALWAQCGGSTFFGRKYACPAPQVCTYLNEFYSQCLPVPATSSSVAPITSASITAVPVSTLKTTTKKTTSSSVKNTTTKTSSSTTTTKAAATPTVTWVAMYGQCNGSLSYQWANVQCQPPGICVYENQFFSNCFPPAVSASSDTAVPTAV